MGKQRRRRGDFWAHLIADILVRIGLFVGTAALVIAAFYRHHHRYSFGDGDFPSAYMIGVVIVAATLAAVFGPWLYRSESEHGRGSLAEVKRNSEPDKRGH